MSTYIIPVECDTMSVHVCVCVCLIEMDRGNQKICICTIICTHKET